MWSHRDSGHDEHATHTSAHDTTPTGVDSPVAVRSDEAEDLDGDDFRIEHGFETDEDSRPGGVGMCADLADWIGEEEADADMRCACGEESSASEGMVHGYFGDSGHGTSSEDFELRYADSEGDCRYQVWQLSGAAGCCQEDKGDLRGHWTLHAPWREDPAKIGVRKVREGRFVVFRVSSVARACSYRVVDGYATAFNLKCAIVLAHAKLRQRHLGQVGGDQQGQLVIAFVAGS